MRIVFLVLLTGVLLPLLLAQSGTAPSAPANPPAASQPAAGGSKLGSLPVWDDGFAEICYYDAKITIGDRVREYTRVHLLNREWFDPQQGTKTEVPDRAERVPAFKLNIVEHVPQPNYPIHFLTTLIVHRHLTEPFRLDSASQDWSGLTYRRGWWKPEGLTIESYSHFDGEGERNWQVPIDLWPFESLFLIAREMAAGGEPPYTRAFLPPLRDVHQVTPRDLIPESLQAGPVARIRVPAGEYETRVILFTARDTLARFWVETAPPYRLIKFDTGRDSGELRFAEHRAYWDHTWPGGPPPSAATTQPAPLPAK